MLLVELVQLMMLNIKCMSMMSILTIGTGYLPQGTTLVFLTSLVASWLLLVDVCLLQRQGQTRFPHVIVAGGMKKRDILLIQDSIEVFNWIENSQWRMVSINLPVPMYSFTPIITGDYYLIIGYIGAKRISSCSVYKIPVRNITISDRPQKRKKAAGWIMMSSPSHSGMAIVPKSFPPMVIGGVISGTVPTADIKIYDCTAGSWKNTALLSFARTGVAVATVSDNAIIVLGGCTSMENVKYSSLNIVELGQAQLK